MVNHLQKARQTEQWLKIEKQIAVLVSILVMIPVNCHHLGCMVDVKLPCAWLTMESRKVVREILKVEGDRRLTKPERPVLSTDLIAGLGEGEKGPAWLPTIAWDFVAPAQRMWSVP
jgi:hypothetical protein